MTFKEYTNLTETDQDWILWSCGVAVAKRSDKLYNYILYQVEGFYIELKFHAGQKKVIAIYSFDDINLIDPYLDELIIHVSF